MDDLWRNVGVIAGTLTSVCVLLGLAVRFILVPYLRDHLVKPVQETHRQVTQNHVSNEPTMIDRLDEVRDAVGRLESTTIAVQAVANAAARSSAGAHRRLDQHAAWADVETSRLWSAVRRPPSHRTIDAEREERD